VVFVFPSKSKSKTPMLFQYSFELELTQKAVQHRQAGGKVEPEVLVVRHGVIGRLAVFCVAPTAPQADAQPFPNACHAAGQDRREQWVELMKHIRVSHGFHSKDIHASIAHCNLF
jgi:hypothetical protein